MPGAVAAPGDEGSIPPACWRCRKIQHPSLPLHTSLTAPARAVGRSPVPLQAHGPRADPAGLLCASHGHAGPLHHAVHLQWAGPGALIPIPLRYPVRGAIIRPPPLRAADYGGPVQRRWCAHRGGRPHPRAHGAGGGAALHSARCWGEAPRLTDAPTASSTCGGRLDSPEGRVIPPPMRLSSASACARAGFRAGCNTKERRHTGGPLEV